MQFTSFAEIGPALACEQGCLENKCRLEKQKLKFSISLMLDRNYLNRCWKYFIEVTEGNFIPYTGLIKLLTKAKFRC